MIAAESNPFLNPVVQSPWSLLPADIPAFNRPVFDLLKDLTEEVARGAGAGSTSIVLCGDAGSGKTHLLARFRGEFLKQSHGVSAVIPIQTAPEFLSRQLRRSFASELLQSESAGARTPLERLLAAKKDPPPPGLLHSLSTILEHYRAGRYRPQCARWLRGEPVEQEVLEVLGLATPEDLEEASHHDEERALQTVVDLCQWISPTPVVLLFQSLESLELIPGDFSAWRLFAQTLTHLLAEVKNVVAVLPMLTSFEARLEENLDPYLISRLMSHRAELLPMEPAMAADLLKKRLDSVPQLAGMRSNLPRQPFWPIEEQGGGIPSAPTPPRSLLIEAQGRFTAALHLSTEKAAESAERSEDGAIAALYRSALLDAHENPAWPDFVQLFATAFPDRFIDWQLSPAPAPELAAAAEAICALRAAAASAKLMDRGAILTVDAVNRWFAQFGPPELARFLKEATEPPAAKDRNAITELFELVERKSIVNLEEAALALKMPAAALKEYARHHPLQIGYLAGPPAVLFHALARPAGDPRRPH